MIWKVNIMLLLITISFSQRINLNSTSIEEMQTLDLTLEQIENIVTFRKRSGQINSIYELLSIPGITIADIHAIRDAVTVEIPQASTFEKDMQRAAYKLGRWITNEGSTEGLSEIWLDRFYEPKNINDMTYDKLPLWFFAILNCQFFKSLRDGSFDSS